MRYDSTYIFDCDNCKKQDIDIGEGCIELEGIGDYQNYIICMDCIHILEALLAEIRK